MLSCIKLIPPKSVSYRLPHTHEMQGSNKVIDFFHLGRTTFRIVVVFARGDRSWLFGGRATKLDFRCSASDAPDVVYNISLLTVHTLTPDGDSTTPVDLSLLRETRIW